MKKKYFHEDEWLNSEYEYVNKQNKFEKKPMAKQEEEEELEIKYSWIRTL